MHACRRARTSAASGSPAACYAATRSGREFVDLIGDEGGSMEGNCAVAAIGIRELEEQTREVLRRVREDGETVDVIDGATVIARIVPVKSTVDPQALEERWNQVDRLAEEIDRSWPDGVSAAEAVAEQRREL
jgi:antitoxin (DNA-binding transcriptional repressor) of toxin-antitoxin stability system